MVVPEVGRGNPDSEVALFVLTDTGNAHQGQQRSDLPALVANVDAVHIAKQELALVAMPLTMLNTPTSSIKVPTMSHQPDPVRSASACGPPPSRRTSCCHAINWQNRGPRASVASFQCRVRRSWRDFEHLVLRSRLADCASQRGALSAHGPSAATLIAIHPIARADGREWPDVVHPAGPFRRSSAGQLIDVRRRVSALFCHPRETLGTVAPRRPHHQTVPSVLFRLVERRVGSAE